MGGQTPSRGVMLSTLRSITAQGRIIGRGHLTVTEAAARDCATEDGLLRHDHHCEVRRLENASRFHSDLLTSYFDLQAGALTWNRTTNLRLRRAACRTHYTLRAKDS